MRQQMAALSMTLIITLMAQYTEAKDEATGVARRHGNPSPTAAASNIDNYLYQDDQLNLTPDDEDVLVLRVNQKNLLNRYVTKTFRIENVAVREVRDVLRQLAGKEGGHVEVIRDREGNENLIQVICPEWQLEYLERALAVLDKEWLKEFNDGTETLYYQPKHRDVRFIDNILTRSSEVGEGFSELDPKNNAVMRLDEPYRIYTYQRTATVLDQPEYQARFKVRIYEIDIHNDQQLGLDYIAWKNGPGRNLAEFGLVGYSGGENYHNAAGFLTPFDPRALEAGWGSRAFNNFSRYSYFNLLMTTAYLDFLSSKGKVKTAAEGVIQVRSGSSGSFGALDQVVSFDVTPHNPGPHGTSPARLEAISGISDTGDYAVADRRVRHRATGQVGTLVEIEPAIMRESIQVNIRVTVSSVSGQSPQGLPIISASYSETAARMKDGSVLVLSGLTRTEKVNHNQGMPWLSSIPVVGYLFGGEKSANREKQIVVVIESESELGGESLLAHPPEIATMAHQVTGESPVELPANSFGFDQWLLGRQSGAEL